MWPEPAEEARDIVGLFGALFLLHNGEENVGKGPANRARHSETNSNVLSRVKRPFHGQVLLNKLIK